MTCACPSCRSGLGRRRLLATAGALGVLSALKTDEAVAATAPPLERAETVGRLPDREDLLIRGARVLTMDERLGELPRGDVRVRAGRIVDVAPTLDAAGARVIDARGMLLLPGFVDTHWHLWNGFLRSHAGGDRETGYFPTALKYGRRCQPVDAYRSVRLCLAEALSSGITTVHNWAHNLRGPAFADAEVRAMREMGVRGRFSYGTPQGLAPDQPMDFDDLARVQRTWFGAEADGLLRLGLAARGPERAPAQVPEEWATARRLGLPISVHIASTPAFAKMEGVRGLAAAGRLGPDVQLVHVNYTSVEERALIARAGSPVAMTPISEMRIGFGVPRPIELGAAGIGLSLGIDTLALAGAADMFASMRAALWAANAAAQSEFAMTAKQVLHLATLGGARDHGLEDAVGSVSPGKRADLQLLRLGDLNVSPLNDAARLVVESGRPDNVDTVLVDGRVLKAGGRLTHVDVGLVVAEAAASLAAVTALADNP